MERNDHTQADEPSLSDEARSKSSFKRLFSSSDIFLPPEMKLPQRPELQMGLIIQSKAAQHCTNGKEAMGTSQYEKAVVCFSKAINLQPQQARLHQSQAEAYLQLCDFQSAAACYKRAWILEPGACAARLAFVYFLQGQCLFDRGLFLEALQAFSKAAEVKPGCRTYEVKSLACLAAAGRAADGLKLVTNWMLLDGPTSDLYVLRARLHQLLQQMSSCHGDVRSALALSPRCPHAAALLLQLHEAAERHRQKAVDAALSGRLPDALCRTNMALENCPRNARLYLFRGILYRRLKDFTSAIEDLVQAVEVSEEEEEEEEKKEAEAGQQEEGRGSVVEEAQLQLVLTYNDLAVECFSRGFYAEATLLLNRAVEQDQGRAGLYLNRGDCFFKQGEWCFALADYEQAQEMMRPGDAAVRLRLAVLHSTLGSACFQDGCFQEAVDMFSLALRCDPAAARYYESRSKAFRKLLDPDGARRDLICTLVLDPSSEELPPMLMDLFPGCSAADVLSSAEGRAVSAQLMDSIQTCSASSDQQSLSEDLLKMTLTNHNAASRPADPCEAGLKLCVSQVKIPVKSLLQPQSRLTTTPGLRDLHHTPPPAPPAPPSSPAAPAAPPTSPPLAAPPLAAPPPAPPAPAAPPSSPTSPPAPPAAPAPAPAPPLAAPPAAPAAPVEQDQSTFTHNETDQL